MNKKTFLKPKKGLRVPDPATGEPLPENGKAVEMNTYWQRRINDGDVEKTKPDKQQAEPGRGPGSKKDSK